MKLRLATICFCAVFVLLFAMPSFAAVGCTLSNPARDLKSLFPEMTTYREDVKEFTKMPDGQEKYDILKARLGDALDPVYESFETPYTLYSIYKGDELLGYVHGVNVAGKGGVIQIFLSVDPQTAQVEKMLFQRLESLGSKQLRSKEFRNNFVGLTMGDFYKHDYFAAKDAANTADKVGQIKPPQGLDDRAMPDYETVMRGVRKDLLLLELFAFDMRHEPFFERAQSSLKQ